MRRRNEPLYLVIAKELKEEILNGKFSKEEKLPSETKLRDNLGVSRTTVREAVGILERDGLVNRVHGVGTIITRSRFQLSGGKQRLRSFTELIEEQKMRPGTNFKNFVWNKADSKAAQVLDVKVGSPIAVIERVRTGDGRPMIYTIDQISSSIIGDNFSLQKMGESLFAYLKEEKGIILTDSELIIRASGVEDKIAAYLELKPESPVLSVEETYYDNHHKPIIYCVNIYRTDRYFFKVNI